MKRLILIHAVLVAFVFTATSALAGVEPSPFTPEINQCNAAVNMLDATDHKLDITLDKAPVEGENINGALNQLETTEKRILSVGSFIDSIFSDIAAVMGTEPSPFNDPDLITAFETVKSAAQQVVDTSQRELPAGVPSQFIDALNFVGDSADRIVQKTEGYIEQLSGTPTGCVIDESKDEFACMENVNCAWDPTTGTCCCIP